MPEPAYCQKTDICQIGCYWFCRIILKEPSTTDATLRFSCIYVGLPAISECASSHSSQILDKRMKR